MKLRAILLALALAACGQTGEKAAPTPAQPEGPDANALHIEIGRFGAMLGQVEELTEQRSGSAETEITAPAELARNLRERVWQYNLQRSGLCAKGLFTELTCGPSYEPVWIAEPSSTQPTLVEIQTRSDALGEEVSRLWGAVCDDARSRVTGEQEKAYTCAME